MSQNKHLGELGQIVTVNAAANSMSVGNTTIHNNGITIGNTSVHSNGVTISGQSINNTSYPGTANNANNLGGVPAASYVNTSGSYTISGVHTHDANVVIQAGIIANGGVGSAGQSLISNGSSAYWATAGATLNANNTDSQTFYIGLSNNSTGAWTNAVVATSKLNFVPSTGTLTVDTATVNATNYTGTANNTQFVGSVSAANVVSNAQLQANASTTYSNAVSYVDTKIGTANLAIANAYTNATTFAANASNISSGTIAEARLPYRMNQDVRNTDSVTFNGMTLTGNLVVSGNVNIVGANNLSLVDNMIYLNSNSSVTNPDLGIAGNYNDGTYRHTGFFRDATDGFWKVYDNYGPEPDASPYIDTSNSTFHIANFWANTIYVGNTSVYATVNTTNFTGTANNASYLGGTAAASYLLSSTAASTYLPSTTAASTYLPLAGGTMTGIIYNGTSASLVIGQYSGATRGYLYNDTSGFGLLSNGGNWAARVDYGSQNVYFPTYAYAAGSLRAPIFYDTNDTGYYLDPASTSNFNALQTYSYQGNGNVGGTGSAAWFPSGLYSATGAQCWIYGDINRGGAATTNGGAYYGTIFYDNNDSGFYVDPNSTSRFVTTIIGGHGGTPYNTASSGRLYFGSNGDNNYSVYTGMEDYGGNYTKLTLDWHTGIRIGAYYSYGGIRFYNNSVNAGGTEVFSVARGDSNVRVVNNLYVPFIYDSNDTSYYCDPNSYSSFSTLRCHGNELYLRGGSPTLHFEDTDEQCATLHNNSNLFYILRHNSYTVGWTTVGSGWWPMTLNLTNNDVSWGGNITAAYNVTAYASDRRLKENIKEIPNAIEKIKAIRGVTFDWNDIAEENGFVPERKEDDIGCIAQEVQAVLPHVVTLAPFDRWKPDPGVDYTPEELEKMDTSRSGENYLTIQYDRMVPLLVQAIKEQQAQIEELKSLILNNR